MPLSEQEQRMLDEMERHLMQNDADVVTAPSGDRTLSYRNFVYGALLLLAGVGGLIAAVTLAKVAGGVSIAIGVVAFLVMLTAVIVAFTPVRRKSPAESRSTGAAKSSSSASFMDRMNDRWDRRQEER